MLEIKYRPVDATTLVHPLENQEILSLQKDGTFDYIVQNIGNLRLHLGSLPKSMLERFPVNENTYPRLYGIYQEVRKRLNCEEEYPLFVDFGYNLIAKSYGSAKNGHMIVINSACLREFNDGELAAMLGREIGHIQNGHIQYREMIDSIHLITNGIAVAGEIVKEKISSFFSKWMIVSEFTADRAGLMACGGYENMATMLMRQMGVAPSRENLWSILKQKDDHMPEKMGINYMIMARAFPSIGMVTRIKELDNWINSVEFRNRYPFIHYMGKAYLQRKTTDEMEKTLILLHQRASNGNTAAQVRLARDYITGKETLPKAYEPYLALIQEASYRGSGIAMYALYQAFKANLDILKGSSRLREQLLRAAGSRNSAALEAASQLPALGTMTALPRFINMFAKRYGESAKCLLNFQCIGEPLQGEIAEEITDAFWMMAGEPVYAAELEETNGTYYGTALSPHGIYGRLKGKRFPFMIPWSRFKQEEVHVVNDGFQEYLACGGQRISRWKSKEDMIGTINDIILTIMKLK